MSMSEATDKPVFISYCHEDNEEFAGERWVEKFHTYLRTRLRQILGREKEPGIWRDAQMAENQVFSDVLMEKLQQVEVVIAVLSPNYVDSKWCQREIEAFTRARQDGLQVGKHRKRIFNVVKVPVPQEKYPPVLQGQTGYKFYRTDKVTEKLHFFSLSGKNDREAVAEKITDLAYHLVETLNASAATHGAGSAATGEAPATEAQKPAGDAAKPEAAAPISAGPSALTIYLAETSFDLDDEALKVRREFEGCGYRVLPAGELPVRRATEFRSAVGEALDQCQLSVHMIGANRPTIPAEETDDIVVLQNELAAERSAIDRLIWLPPGLSSGDENHQQFIDKLKRDSAAQGNADLLQAPLHELKCSIHETLEKRAAARKPDPVTDQAAATTMPQQIYVCYAQDDKDAVSPVIDYLYDSGFEVLEPLLDTQADDEQVIDVHKRNLSDCDAALLFADQGGEYWLKTQMSELRKAPHLRGNRPMLARAIYLGPGMNDIKVRTQDLLLKGDEEFAPDTLVEFVAKLGEGGGVPA